MRAGSQCAADHWVPGESSSECGALAAGLWLETADVLPAIARQDASAADILSARSLQGEHASSLSAYAAGVLSNVR